MCLVIICTLVLDHRLWCWIVNFGAGSYDFPQEVWCENVIHFEKLHIIVAESFIFGARSSFFGAGNLVLESTLLVLNRMLSDPAPFWCENVIHFEKLHLYLLLTIQHLFGART